MTTLSLHRVHDVDDVRGDRVTARTPGRVPGGTQDRERDRAADRPHALPRPGGTRHAHLGAASPRRLVGAGSCVGGLVWVVTLAVVSGSGVVRTGDTSVADPSAAGWLLALGVVVTGMGVLALGAVRRR